MIIIRGADTMEFAPARLRHNQDIVIDGDQITAVGPQAATDLPLLSNADTTVIDGTGKLVFPGLVCSHTHYYSGLARAIMAEIGPTPDFVSILKNLWWRLDRANTLESLSSAALVSSIEAIKAGTTTVVDHHAGPRCISGSLETIKRAFERVGLRGATCYEVTDRTGLDDMRAGVDENLAFAKLVDAQAPAGSRLVEAHIGGHALCTLPDAALELIADAVSSTGKGAHIHVAEDQYDVSHSHITYGKDIAERLDEFGLLGNKTILAHAVYFSESEVELLNERDGFLVHNCRSNMNNAVGYNDLLPAWNNVALGTDGIGADMFEETKHAFFKHRDSGGALQGGDILGFLANGNRMVERIFGRKFGCLQSDHAADLVIAEYNAPTPLTEHNIAGHVIFGMNSAIVETVIVGGKIVMKNREFEFDLSEVYAEARSEARALWSRMNEL
ncbi:MAG: putative aminohydrolase SsnA [Spirochaetaceae bacterium]|nr:MAG: putative aminohydrolase SsnA [Spirochaetaceae bacterium]